MGTGAAWSAHGRLLEPGDGPQRSRAGCGRGEEDAGVVAGAGPTPRRTRGGLAPADRIRRGGRGAAEVDVAPGCPAARSRSASEGTGLALGTHSGAAARDDAIDRSERRRDR